MNDRISKEATELDQYSSGLEKEIRRYEHLYGVYVDGNPDIAIMLAERLDALYASRYQYLANRTARQIRSGNQ